MGARGPSKIPTALKVLRGETRPSRLNPDQPRPRGTLRAPADLTTDARRVWRRSIAAMGKTGILTAADRDSLRCYCEAVVRYEESARLLERSGPLVKGARTGELVKNPLHQVVRDNAMLIRAFARELGFLPAAREGIRVGSEGHDDLDAWLSEGSA